VAENAQDVTLADVARRLDTVSALLVCLINGTKGPGLAVALSNTGMPLADVAALLGIKVQAIKDARYQASKKGK
jgi:hypothetical protein